jgi:hypothetical protein
MVPTMGKRACLHGEVGQATLLFVGSAVYAQTLAQAVGDPDWKNLVDFPVQSVECMYILDPLSCLIQILLGVEDTIHLPRKFFSYFVA